MASHPQFPIQNPLVQYNPLVNALRDVSGRNRTVQDVINDSARLQEFKIIIIITRRRRRNTTQNKRT